MEVECIQSTKAPRGYRRTIRGGRLLPPAARKCLREGAYAGGRGGGEEVAEGGQAIRRRGWTADSASGAGCGQSEGEAGRGRGCVA